MENNYGCQYIIEPKGINMYLWFNVSSNTCVTEQAIASIPQLFITQNIISNYKKGRKMKKILIIALMALGMNTIQAQEIKTIEAEGNLESPNPCGCVELSEVTNKNNPADILTGMGKCIELKDFTKAAKLFAISGVYGTYDISRVKDKSAHQALFVLQQNILMNISKEDKDSLIISIKKTLEKDSKELNNICQTIRKIGKPDYYPKYMVSHGLQAFLDNKGDGLVEDFKSEESWNLALTNYLHCGE